ncbi:hypothetical protein D3C77_450530 [compost metagenome]
MNGAGAIPLNGKTLGRHPLLHKHQMTVEVVGVAHGDLARRSVFICLLEGQLEHQTLRGFASRGLDVVFLEEIVDELTGLNATGYVESRELINKYFDGFKTHFSILLSSSMITSTSSIDLVSKPLSRSATLPNFFASLVLIKLTSIPSLGVLGFTIGRLFLNIG